MKSKTKKIKKYLIFLLYSSIIIVTDCYSSDEAEIANDFIYPVSTIVSDPRVNSDQDECKKSTGKYWYSNHNYFGNKYCPTSLGCSGGDCYHPGEDWNMCPSNTDESKLSVDQYLVASATNKTAKEICTKKDNSCKFSALVYSIGNGKVVRRATVNKNGSGNGYYVTIEHKLPKEENRSDYTISGTKVNQDYDTFDVIFSSYLHIDPSVVENQIVKKGDIIGTISSCCSHLHFEIKTAGIGSNSCGGCGYCDSHQDITDKNFLDPSKFISTHIKENINYDENTSTKTEKFICSELIIDKSGSMHGDKYNNASIAVDSFIDRCTDQDYFGLTAFSNNASVVSSLISFKTNENRTLVKDKKNKVKCGGSTNIGAGLSVGLQDLRQCDASMQKAIVLLSDGENNTGDYGDAINQARQAGIPIYTVAYGGKSGVATLQQIASDTGGWYAESQETDITTVYFKIAGMTKGESGITQYYDAIEQGRTLAYVTDIPSDFRSVTFSNSYQGSHVDLSLKTPSGNHITSGNFQEYPGIKYTEAPTYSFFTIDKPDPGRWTIELFGADIPSKEQVNTLVTGASPLMLNSYSAKSFYEKNQPVPIKIKAGEMLSGKMTKPKSIEIHAIVRKPSPSLFRNTTNAKQTFDRTLQDALSGKVNKNNIGKVAGDLLNKLFLSKNKNEGINAEGLLDNVMFGEKKIVLYDDGKHMDLEAGDSIYGGVYRDTDIEGPYAVEINCTAETQEGERIERTIRESFQVGDILQNNFTLSDFLGLFVSSN